MTRDQFLELLERGLRRLPPGKRADILADYRSYFAEGAAAGRDEHAVADSLGNPARLAAELRVGHDARQSAVRGFLGLAAIALIDGVRWFPLVVGLLAVTLLIGVAAVAAVYAVFTLVVLPFDMPLGGIAAVLLRVVALLAATLAALCAARAGVQLLVKYFIRPPFSEVSP